MYIKRHAQTTRNNHNRKKKKSNFETISEISNQSQNQ